MNVLKGACIIGQSGGPTSVINASAYGVIDTALKSGAITRVLGAEHGIKGVLNDRLFDMGQEDPEELRLLKYTPSSALGSCRYKLADPAVDDTDYKRILEIFKKYDVRYFFYNGGNDSMDTCNKINQYMQSVGYECRVMGVPKTIDNDLFGTDHCPGYASAAKYIATSMMEVYLDSHVYDTGMIVIMEIMGRHAGWLAASAALAGEYGAGPDLIYLPETDFEMPKFIEDVKRVYAEKGNCLVAVSEGIHYADGGFVSDAKVEKTDGFGHAQMGGLASILAEVIKEETGAKVRGIELNLLQRCGAHLASETDIEESYMAGKAAVENAVAGINGRMIAFERGIQNGRYACKTKLVPLMEVANVEKKIPREWINEDGTGVTHRFIEYALPLIQGEPDLPKQDSLPRFAKLKKVLAKYSIYTIKDPAAYRLPDLLSSVFLIDQPQPFHQQILVVNDLVAAVAHDDRRVAAGGHDGGLFVGDNGEDPVDNAVQHAGRAIDDAVAHAVLGVFSDDVLRGMLQRHILQQRRMLRQRIQRKPHAREHHAPLIGSLLGDIGNGGGCPHFDHDNGRGILLQCRHSVGHQIGAQLVVHLHADVQPCLDAGPHHHRLPAQQAGQCLVHHEIDARHHAGENGAADIPDVITVQRE